MIDAEKVALARALMASYTEDDNDARYCRHCGNTLCLLPSHTPDCPVPLAQRVIAESEK
jgi:hypothetical protein